MRIKLNFGAGNRQTTKPLNKEVNGFINKILGENNEYHGKFSRYSVSSMQGGVINNGFVTFPNGGSVYVSSDDETFMSLLIIGLLQNGTKNGVLDMPYENYDIAEFDVNDRFDLVRTISPISIRDNNVPLTFKDNNFCPHILTVSKKKLMRCGYSEKDVNTLSMELFHPENAKTKMVEIGKAKIICNKVMLLVHGKKHIRKALYELGIGTSTGFGFGAVTINKKY